MNHLLKNSKKGVTLVEAVLALVILALIAAAVFSQYAVCQHFNFQKILL